MERFFHAGRGGRGAWARREAAWARSDLRDVAEERGDLPKIEDGRCFQAWPSPRDG